MSVRDTPVVVVQERSLVESVSANTLHPLPEIATTAAETLRAGQSVEFVDWGGRQRRGEVVEVGGPLLWVAYRLASGQPRTAWIDVLHLNEV